jgi:hypothetical protein
MNLQKLMYNAMILMGVILMIGGIYLHSKPTCTSSAWFIVCEFLAAAFYFQMLSYFDFSFDRHKMLSITLRMVALTSLVFAILIGGGIEPNTSKMLAISIFLFGISMLVTAILAKKKIKKEAEQEKQLKEALS